MNEATYVLQALLFFLPAGVANMTPVLANKVPLLNRWHTPVDFGLTVRGKRLFGDHKTWRGILFGTLAGSLTGILIPSAWYGDVFPDVSWAVFAAMSFGALAGDATKSFFKRQVNRPSGSSWFPFDQIDYIAGGLVAILPFAVPSIKLCLVIGIGYFVIHLLSTIIAYRLDLKDSPI